MPGPACTAAARSVLRASNRVVRACPALLLGIGALLAGATGLAAQTAQPALRDSLRSDVRAVGEAQGRFLAQHHRYAASLGELHYAPSPGDDVQIPAATAGGFLAAGRAGGGSIQCILFTGDVSAQLPPDLARYPDRVLCSGDAEFAAFEAAMAAQRNAAVRAAMENDLRNVVTAQEAYHGAHGQYAPTLDALRYRASEGMGIVLSGVTRESWTAKAYASIPTVCLVFVGPRPEGVPPEAGERVPYCAAAR